MNAITSILCFVVAPAALAMAILAAQSYFNQPRKYRHWRDIKPRLSWRFRSLWWCILDAGEMLQALCGRKSPRQPKFRHPIDTLRR